MHAIQHKLIAVFPEASRHFRRRLLDSLAELYPIDFVPPDRAGFKAAIFFSQEGMRAEQAFERGVSSFVFEDASGGVPLAADASVSFSNHAALHPAFRSVRIPLGKAAAAAELKPGESDSKLASHDSLGLWLFRSNGEAELHTTAFGPPDLEDGELLWLHLQPQDWLSLLPLLHFLRRVTADMDWSPAPQQASFIFDDPNLHALRYGYLDFTKLAREADEHNYHAALATVPLDAWYAARKPVELFHQCPQRLSLLIHGNNHVKNELAQEYGDGEALRTLAQALRRIGGLERRTGLKVSRVVAAPHGVCSEFTIAQMMRLPLEGACVSAGPMVRSNPKMSWPLSFGLSPVCVMAGGFPVIRRFHLRYGLLFLRFAAFLGQPIVPYGHHEDCADGLRGLAEIADTVNSWGRTSWADLESVIRSHCRTKRDGDSLHVEMCARRARVMVPDGVSHVVVDRQATSEADGDGALTAVSAGMRPETWALGVPNQVTPSTVLNLSISSPGSVDPASVGRPSYRLWPPVRRMLAIGRDRVRPILSHWSLVLGPLSLVSRHFVPGLMH